MPYLANLKNKDVQVRLLSEVAPLSYQKAKAPSEENRRNILKQIQREVKYGL